MGTLTTIRFTLPPDHSPEEADLLGGLLAAHVTHGWEEEALPTGELACLVHYTSPGNAEDLLGTVGALLPRVHIVQGTEEEKNWVEAWKEFFTPVEGGSHFLVLAPWMREELAATKRIPVIIEPKTAFGTGHHATTALCLDAISGLFAQNNLKEGMRFLDLGTGSGILGLAMAKLGLAGEGLDIDSAAVENATENRAVNGIGAEDFIVRQGGVEEAKGPYDIVVANILAGPLKDMAPAISALAAPGGGRPILVLSGLLATQAQSVTEAYAAHGYAAPQTVLRGEWAALTFI